MFLLLRNGSKSAAGPRPHEAAAAALAESLEQKGEHALASVARWPLDSRLQDPLLGTCTRHPKSGPYGYPRRASCPIRLLRKSIFHGAGSEYG